MADVLFHRPEDQACLPETIKLPVESLLSREQQETADTESLLQKAWANVEAALQRNKDREQGVNDLKERAQAFADYSFWTADKLKAHFGLESFLDTLSAAEEESSSGDAQPQVGNQHHSDIAELVKSSGGNMPKSAADQLAPIRHCFAPVLRARDSIPVEFTLLVNAIEKLQKNVRPIEEKMAASKYKLPLHIPFLHVASHIRLCMIPQSTGQHLEEFCTTEFNEKLKSLLQTYESLPEEPEGKVVFERLTTEALDREQLHHLGMKMVKEAHHVEQELKQTLSNGQAAARAKCDQALDVIRSHALKVTKTSRGVVDDLRAVERKGAEAFESQSSQLSSHLADVEYKMKNARTKQEKTVRQIRELFKSLRNQQAEYDDINKDFCRTYTDLRRMDAAYEQFKASCADRAAQLKEAHETCVFVGKVIDDVAQQVNFGLKECELQISRMSTEEHFRKMRLAKRPLDNILQWYRCVGDLKHIRSVRLKELMGRMEGSWQLEFLLHNEKDAHEEALDGLDKTTGGIQRHFVNLTQLLVELEVPVPVLQHVDKDANVMRMRSIFGEKEGAGKEKYIREAQVRAKTETSAERLVLPPVPPARRLRQRRESDDVHNDSNETYGKLDERTIDTGGGVLSARAKAKKAEPMPPPRSSRQQHRPSSSNRAVNNSEQMPPLAQTVRQQQQQHQAKASHGMTI